MAPSREWSGYVHEEHAGQDFDVSNPDAPINRQAADTYAAESFEGYGDQLFDERLWERFQDDFDGWTQPHFESLNRTLRGKILDHLRDHGVYAPKIRRETIAERLMTVLESPVFPQYPPEEATATSTRNPQGFISWSNPNFRQRMAPGSAGGNINPLTPQTELQQRTQNPNQVRIQVTPSTPTGPGPARDLHPNPGIRTMEFGQRSIASPSLEQTQRSMSPLSQATRGRTPEAQPRNSIEGTMPDAYEPSFSPSASRALGDLCKAYNNDDSHKFGGGMYDIIDEKMKIFKDRCRKHNVTPDLYPQAFSTMLKGRAEQFYFNHLAEKGYGILRLVDEMKIAFHTTENQQLYMNEWRGASIKNTIKQNPACDLPACLEKLIDQIEKVHKGLSINYLEDVNLKEGMLNAVQGHPAFLTVTINPANDYNGVCSQLRNAAGGWSRLHDQPSQFNTTNFSDRKYENTRPGNQRGNQSRRPFSKSRFQKNGQNNKRCFVCRKPGCWSTKHPLAERTQKRSAWKRYMQEQSRPTTDEEFEVFLHEYEGDGPETDEESNDDPNDFDTWYSQADENDPNQGPNEVVQFLTEYGPIDGEYVTEALANQAAYHAFTMANVFSIHPPPESAGGFLVYFQEDRYSNTFQGIMPDTGAAGISTGGLPQFKALQRHYPEIKLNRTTAGQHRVRFGDNPEEHNIGTAEVPTPFGTIAFQIVPANTPFLLCLKDMDRLGVFFNNVENTLIHKKKAYPVVRKWGHPFYLLDDINNTIIYCHLTEKELQGLHRRFGHPTTMRMHKFLTRAGYEGISQALIDKIVKFCHQCQMHAGAPSRFKFTIRDEVDFNHTIYVDVMYIHQRPVLHAIDQATAFQAARFIKDMTAKNTWDTLRNMWIDTYLGPPDNLVFDAGKNFTAKEFTGPAGAMAINIEEVPVEAHNSIGKLERYHGPLRRAYEVISEDLTGTNTGTADILQMAVKAVNDTAGPDGLVPTLLVFGAYPRISETSPPAASIAVRAKAIQKAMKEVSKLKAQRQIKDAIAQRNGPNTLETLNLPLQAEVRVYRENEKAWTGPYKLIAREGETCTVEINGRPTRFRTTVVKPYHRDETTNPPAEAGEEESASEQEDEDYQPTEERTEAQPKRRGRPPGSKNKPKEHAHPLDAFLTQKEADDQELAIRLRKEGKITSPGAPFELSDTQEIESLIGRGVFAFEKYDERKHGHLRLFNSRIVHEIKGKTTDTPYEKSRLVVQGHSDIEKKSVLTQSPTIQRASQRILVALAPTLMRRGMKTWMRDITQAYTQAETNLTRNIIARLPPQIKDKYPEGTIMHIIKPLYGIAEAGLHWWATYSKHHIDRLRMTTSTFDPCLLVTDTNERFGIVGLQTDDTLGISDDLFDQAEEEGLTDAKFQAKPKIYLTDDVPLLFNGCVITLKNGEIYLAQKAQGKKIETIDPASDTYKQEYVQQRARGAYIASICQPEATYDLAEAAQHQEPDRETVKKLNKRLLWQKENVARGLQYTQVNLETAKIYVFVDGSFANNKDLTSQLGYEIILGNETMNKDSFTLKGNMIHWSSTKSKRVTRSVLASEIYAMMHGVDMAIAVATTISQITNRLGLPDIPLVVCTDSLSLYECLVKLGSTREKRLMIDIMSLRQSYERREITDIRWIHGEDNPADAMTKATPNKALKTFIDDNLITLRLQGWVKRENQPQGYPKTN